MGEVFRFLEIIFEVQRKWNNEKITSRKIRFPTYKMRFSFFGPLLFSNFIIYIYIYVIGIPH
jgi:hypothetical protein